jgi:thioredoxin reductase (NADPH)
MMTNETTENLIILGTGPAGLTAAIYAARANLNPLVIEGYQSGGQLMITTEVENYPGFAQGIMGPALMDEFRGQAERFGTRFVFGEATKVDFDQRPFTIEIDGGNKVFRCEALIVATGATARWLGLESEKKYQGRGVSACATCDGAFFRDKIVAVVGGGDSAVEEATFLTRFASKVYLIHRRDELRASKIMQKRLFDNPKTEAVWNAVVTDVLSADGKAVSALQLKDTQTGALRELAVDGIFVAIGHDPNTKIFQGRLAMDEQGYLLVKAPSTYTNVEGVFACGDVADKTYRQAITAAGTGCRAAIDAERWLEARES